jgi:hypothetical protein
MGAASRCFVVPLAALLLAASSLRAQDGAPIEQPAGEPLPVLGPSPCGPSFWFEADWLWKSHAGMWADTRNFIDGPDATSFDSLPAFSADNGYRLQGGVRLRNWIFEGVYSHFGDWESSLDKTVNGVAFNAGAVAGKWAGENSINGSTYFTPIANSANVTSPANTAGDQSGLGPCASFAADSRPVLWAYSHSDFYMTEANVKRADYLVPLFGRGLRLGAGYVNANLNSDAWVVLSGTFRDVSNSGGATVSLPNSVLTAAGGGDLTLYAGGGTGFTDGTTTGGTPSQCVFTHQATTRNELNGAQVVLDGDLLEFHRFNLGANLKAGMFDNFAQGTVVETYSETNNDLSAYARRFTASCHHLAFMGGVGVNAGYHLTDEIVITAGYDVLFLSNLALAQEQVNGISNAWYHVQTDGTAIIQSVRTGVEIAF